MSIVCLNIIGILLLVALWWVNQTLKKTLWFKSLFVNYDHETYPDNVWYRKHNERNFDLVNVGSSAAKWAFDYKGLNIKAMNWAQQPQTLVDDFKLIKNFHSILRRGGYVLITIMPFTSLNKKTGLRDTLKYVYTLDGTLLDPAFRDKAYRYRKFPILFKKAAIKAFLKYLLKRETPINQSPSWKPMSQAELEKDAVRWIDWWKREFTIADLDAPLTEENQQGRTFRIKLMRDLIDFCKERGYVPVYVIPPVMSYLSRYFTPQFRQIYIYSYLQEVDRDVRTLDYMDDERFQEKEYFRNTFFMSEKGAKKFTREVLSKLQYTEII